MLNERYKKDLLCFGPQRIPFHCNTRECVGVTRALYEVLRIVLLYVDRECVGRAISHAAEVLSVRAEEEYVRRIIRSDAALSGGNPGTGTSLTSLFRRS